VSGAWTVLFDLFLLFLFSPFFQSVAIVCQACWSLLVSAGCQQEEIIDTVSHHSPSLPYSIHPAWKLASNNDNK
jgi:hypothetical protein